VPSLGVGPGRGALFFGRLAYHRLRLPSDQPTHKNYTTPRDTGCSMSWTRRTTATGPAVGQAIVRSSLSWPAPASLPRVTASISSITHFRTARRPIRSALGALTKIEASSVASCLLHWSVTVAAGSAGVTTR